MASMENHAFPTIVYQDGNYVDLMKKHNGDIKEVLKHNKETGNIITFSSEKEAIDFASEESEQSYKKLPSAQEFFNYYDRPPSREFEEESKLNKEKIGRTIYDTIRKVEPHVTRMVETGDLPKEQVKSFMSDAVQAKIGDAVVNKAKELDVYPNFLKQLDVSGRYKGKEDFSVQAGGFEWKVHPYYRSLSKTFGDPEGIHGRVGIDQSKYGDDTYVGGNLVFPLGKPKKQ